ncbi:MAG: hypothetical protein JWO59_2052 [Chloroflexi bacterium]|nr:hypothetical protein [Chloroflexota bacterium]
MNIPDQPVRIALPLPIPEALHSTPGNVLAVVGGVLDAAVVDLALVLAREAKNHVDLLLLAEVPVGLPMRAYGDWLMGRGCEAPLLAAEKTCGPAMGDANVLLSRGIGPALVAELLARQSSCLVISSAEGGWWVRWRGRRGIAQVQAHAECPVYVVHTPLPPHEHVSPRNPAWR